MQTPLVTVEWLHNNLNDPDLIILDASPTANKASMKVKHPDIQITGARYFDLKNTFSDKESTLPNMLPSPEVFTEECRKLGINTNSKIVVYDNLEIYSSPRVWWMFKSMGHDNVSVLDGGLNDWIKAKYPTEAIQKQRYSPGDFVATYHSEKIKNAKELETNIVSKKAIVIDARSAARFNSEVDEPRKGLRRGKIPNSCNIPFGRLIKDGKFLPKAALKQIFDALDLKNKPLVFSCGSGMTACIVLLASELVLENENALYDGSWSEWGLE